MKQQRFEQAWSQLSQSSELLILFASLLAKVSSRWRISPVLKAKRSTTTSGWDVVFLINKHHHFELNANTIKDQGELEKMSRIVHNRNGGTLDGCIGALDGMAVKITKPSQKDAANALSYLKFSIARDISAST